MISRRAGSAMAVWAVAALLTGCGSTTVSTQPTSGTAAATVTTVAPTTAGTGGEPTATPPTRDDPTTTASPVATTPATPAASGWDPCGFSESELSAAGLSATGKQRVTTSKYPACKWMAADGSFDLVAVASADSLDTVLAPGTYTDLRRSTYYGHDFAVFRSVQDSNKIGCITASVAQFGTAVLTLRFLGGSTASGDPCHAVQKASAALTKNLP
ncbi:DUF3558 family protein [Nocardia sp. NPDC058058]|uniref:DUF3558 family protein n=1 Tax=Nocardia sp. NPDC058058 TaxID=3346317 RepID=UPI0036DC0E3B